MTKALRVGGRLLVLVPQGHRLRGALDSSLGLKRRFRRAELQQLLEAHSLEVEAVHQINKASAPVWLLQSRIFRRKKLGKPMLKLFDKTAWLWRLLDNILPWPGLSLIMVARKRAA